MIAVQLAVRTGATVIGVASERHDEWLRGHGVVPVAYGDGVANRVREAAGDGVDAFLDLVGGGYVELALKLGVAPERINTIAATYPLAQLRDAYRELADNHSRGKIVLHASS